MLRTREKQREIRLGTVDEWPRLRQTREVLSRGRPAIREHVGTIDSHHLQRVPRKSCGFEEPLRRMSGGEGCARLIFPERSAEDHAEVWRKVAESIN